MSISVANIRNRFVRRATLIVVVVPWACLMILCAGLVEFCDDCLPIVRDTWRGPRG